MKSILRDLYFGEIRPFEKPMPNNPNYHIEREKYSAAIDELHEQLLTPDFRHIENAIGDYFSLVEEQAFYDGFELGAMLMIEMYTRRNDASRN